MPADPPISLLAWALSLPDDEMIGWVWTTWLAAQMEAKGIPLSSHSPQLIEIIRLETLKMNTGTAADAALLQVMKDIATGHRPRAAKMFRELMAASAVDLVMFNQVLTSRFKQRERASRLRVDELNGVIHKIVEKQPNISAPDLVLRLEQLAMEGDKVIQEVTDGFVYVNSRKGSTKKIGIAALPSRLSRIKQRIRKSR